MFNLEGILAAAESAFSKATTGLTINQFIRWSGRAQGVVFLIPDQATWVRVRQGAEKTSAVQIVMTEDESRPLIDYLVRHATKHEFVYRHQWRADDIVVWDNRCTMHCALGDFDETQLRHLERTTVLGTPSGYVAQAA